MAFTEIWYFNHFLLGPSPVYETSIVHWRGQKIGVQCFDYWKERQKSFVHTQKDFTSFFSCSSAGLEKENKRNDCVVFLEVLRKYQ